MERRKISQSAEFKSSTLPLDYVKMVENVFSNHFDVTLKTMEKTEKNPHFKASGSIYSNEIVLGVSLVSENKLGALTVFASSDFDPKASAPTAEELLAACIDAVGGVFDSLLDEKQPEALGNAPFLWTEMEANQRKIFFRVDRSNPSLEAQADDWLEKHDPELKEEKNREHKETEKLFVTGPSKKNRGLIN